MGLGHLGEGLALVLAEVDGHLAAGGLHQLALGVHLLLHAGGHDGGGQRLHVAGQVGVALHLGAEHVHGGRDVGHGGVRVLVVAVAEEADRALQAVAHVLLEHLVGVHHLGVALLPFHAHAPELLLQQRDVKAPDVVPGQVGVLEQGGHLGGHLLEAGLVTHVVVGDAVHLGGGRGDGHAGVDPLVQGLARPVGIHAHQRHLDDAVLAEVGAGGLEVEEDEGTLEGGQGHGAAPGVAGRVRDVAPGAGIK